jgi:hypothetical protein
MKNLFLLLIILTFLMPAQAQQDTTKVKVLSKKIIEVNEDASGKTEVTLLDGKINILDNSGNDTTSIRIGRRNIEIVEEGGRTDVSIHRIEKDENERGWRRGKHFDGHWSGFELGFNGLANKDYSLYPPTDADFMELDQPKSMEVNLNFLEYNILLNDNSIGLVTGMGFSMNNYRFDNDLTIAKGTNGNVEPRYATEEEKMEKSKLTVSYLTVPLLLEFQIPVNGRSNRLFISAGLIGGINLGSHTKIKYDDSKEKERGSFNINPFKCSATVRAGLKDLSLYASYGLTPLFKEDKGPELFPFSIGISLINF